MILHVLINADIMPQIAVARKKNHDNNYKTKEDGPRGKQDNARND